MRPWRKNEGREGRKEAGVRDLLNYQLSVSFTDLLSAFKKDTALYLWELKPSANTHSYTWVRHLQGFHSFSANHSWKEAHLAPTVMHAMSKMSHFFSFLFFTLPLPLFLNMVLQCIQNAEINASPPGCLNECRSQIWVFMITNVPALPRMLPLVWEAACKQSISASAQSTQPENYGQVNNHFKEQGSKAQAPFVLVRIPNWIKISPRFLLYSSLNTHTCMQLLSAQRIQAGCARLNKPRWDWSAWAPALLILDRDVPSHELLKSRSQILPGQHFMSSAWVARALQAQRSVPAAQLGPWGPWKGQWMDDTAFILPRVLLMRALGQSGSTSGPRQWLYICVLCSHSKGYSVPVTAKSFASKPGLDNTLSQSWASLGNLDYKAQRHSGRAGGSDS